MAVHVATIFLGDRDWVYFSFALFPLPAESVTVPSLQQFYGLVTHGLLHRDFNHLIMNSGGLLIFGLLTFRGVRERFGFGAKGLIFFWLIFWLGVAVGGLFQWAYWAVMTPGYGSAVGASGGVSALFATAGWAIGGRDSMIKFGGAFVIMNALMVWGMGNIAWAAHAGGFIAGAGLAPHWVKPFSAKPSLRL